MSTRVIRAKLKGSNRCEALGITRRGSAPVLALCRALIAAGHDARRPLRAYRGDVLALSISSIGEGAQLTVREDRCGPRFVRWEPFARRVKSRAPGKVEGVDNATHQKNEPRERPGAAAGARRSPAQSPSRAKRSSTGGRQR
jgi:hypothetical protein